MENTTQIKSNTKANEKFYLRLITILSIIVPVVVALLLGLPNKGTLIEGFNIRLLPLMNACINSSVSVLLIIGFVFIKQKKVTLHRMCMLSSLVLSSLFLILYVFYHIQAPATKFGGEGLERYIYFFLLISHILLATTIVPLALLSTYRGLFGQIEKHRKIAKWTFPIWLYVSISGVIVYLMILPYYSKI